MLPEIDGGMLHCVQFAYDIECCRVLKRDTQAECLNGVGVKRTGRRIVGKCTVIVIVFKAFVAVVGQFFVYYGQPA